VDDINKPSAFGRGLLLAGGDLAFNGADFGIVVGKDNLLQGVLAMIGTPFGSDIFNNGYGFDTLAILSGQTTLSQTKDLVRLNIVKSLSQDTRIREIQDVIFDDDPRFIANQTPEAAAQSQTARSTQRRWQAMVVVETVSDGQITIQLEGTGLKS
jgi:hypothetical protein